MKRKSVHIAPFQELPCGTIRFVDVEDDHEGWVVQLRCETAHSEDQPFDIILQDFSNTEIEAMRTAKDLSSLHSCKIVEH